MTMRQVDLRVPAARAHFENFRDLPFVENTKASQGKTPRLSSKALEVSLELAMALYTEAAGWLEAGEVVEFLLPSDCPCPPTGEALMLALAQRELVGAAPIRANNRPNTLATTWLERSHAERRAALNGALRVLSRSTGWRDRRWGEIPVVAANQVAVILPQITGSDMQSKSLANLADAICAIMPAARVTRWAVEEGEEAAQATLGRLDGPPGALIVVARWAGSVDAAKLDYTPDEIKLQLTLGGEPTVKAAALFKAIQSVWPCQTPVLEFATCHGWRLAKAWNKQCPSTIAFGYPGLRNTGLVLHSIADLAVAALGEAIPSDHVVALEPVHNLHVAMQVLLHDSGTPRTYEVMRDLHLALWASTRYARLNVEDPTHEQQQSDDVLAGRRGETAGTQPR